MLPVAELGYFAMALAFMAAVYAVLASAVGEWRQMPALVASGRRALVAVGGLSTLSVGVLAYLFLSHDFSVKYVWQTSSLTTPLFYLLTGTWGGQAGSLLFWAWLVAVFSAVAVLRPWRTERALLPWFTAVAGSITAFFLFLVTFVVNPFERLAVIPADGNGLNPLLQHPGMAFHPPTLYLGFTGLTIPFAFAMAALLSGQLNSGWILASRRWTLLAWAFLSIGLSLGGRWAYDVLGWGGYWGWDPVENAALMPWLAATAFLHSVLIQERRGMFKVWNMFLVILTFALVVIGTFLTRAGLVSSVHAFAQSDIGGYFLVFTAVVCIGSLALLWYRLPALRSDAQIEHAVSRETAFLANNLLFMGALFAVFWGTLFPLFSEVLLGQRVTVGPPYFARLVIPIFWLIFLVMAFGTVVGWRRGDLGAVTRALAGPALASLLLTAGLFALGVHSWLALVGFSTCLFTLLVTLVEIGRGLRARHDRGEGWARAGLRLFSRGRRRYGGYVAHIGMILLAMGVVGSTVYQRQTERSLGVGEALEVGGYRLTFLGMGEEQQADKSRQFAQLSVARGDETVGQLEPGKEVFRLREEEPMTSPAILHLPLEDVYTLLGTYDAVSDRATVKVFVNPLIGLVWLGMVILVLGTLIAAWPDATEERVMNAELKRLTGALPAALGR